MTRRLLLFATIAVVLLASAPSAMATLTFISATDLGVPQDGFGTQAQSPDGHYVYVTSWAVDSVPRAYKVDLSGTTPTTVASAQLPRPTWCAIGSYVCGMAESAAISPDGAFLYVGLMEGVAKLSTADLSTVAMWDEQGAFGSLALSQAVVSPDGRYGYFADVSGVVLKLDLATMTPATSNGSPVVGPFDGVEALILSPDGQTIFGASYSTTSSVITKADTATLTPAATLSTGVPYIYNGVGSPDGRYGYFTDSAPSGTLTTIVKVDLSTMTMVTPALTFAAPKGSAIAISPDGSRLVTGNASNPKIVTEIDTSNAMSMVGEPLVLDAIPAWPVTTPPLILSFISRDGRFAYFPTANAYSPPYPLAKFGLAPGHTLTVAKAGTGTGTITSNVWGIDCGTSCSADYAATAGPITLTATPTAGSTFAGWTGACTGTGTGTCQVTLTTAQSATATFDPPTTFKDNSARVPANAGLHASAKGKVILPLTCPLASYAGCSVSVNVNVTVPDALPRYERTSRLRTIAHAKNITIAAGATKRVTLRLSPAFYQRLRTTRPRRVTTTLRITTAITSRATVTGTQRVPLWIAPITRTPPVTG
ncbi:MAG: WD40 repeat domain-containing protein [Gaiellales bacterium]